jgi:hypothetical protein
LSASPNVLPGKLEHLALHDVRQAVHAADAVGHGDDGALRAQFGRDAEVLDSALQQFADFAWIELHR